MLDYTFSRDAAMGMNIQQMAADAEKLGQDLRNLMLKYTGIDSVKLYNSNEKGSN